MSAIQFRENLSQKFLKVASWIHTHADKKRKLFMDIVEDITEATLYPAAGLINGTDFGTARIPRDLKPEWNKLVENRTRSQSDDNLDHILECHDQLDKLMGQGVDKRSAVKIILAS